MRRVTLFMNGSPKNGQVVAVYGTLSDLLSVASSKLGIKATSVYNGKGGLIDGVVLIRDDDVLFVCEGEPFLDPQTDFKLPEGLSGFHPDWLTLNVGGWYSTTTWSTSVNKEPDSMLAHMFKDKGVWGNQQDLRGSYFEPILNYLPHGHLIVNDGIDLLGVLEEARFFGIDSLVEKLEVAIKNSQPLEDQSPTSRKEFLQCLLTTPTKSELRRQGSSFSGFTLLQSSTRTLLCKNLERADLSGSVLDCANLQGVKILCSDAEGASPKLCNFEDPSGLKANLEGANLKGAIFKANFLRQFFNCLKKCKNCDLSGCDLQEANLRASNVKGAIFEEMSTALHMSQRVR
uniref:KHA domain-containing protein n=1 Tax=Aotus nancymaae TaxID=37293 RepID=A0A2K5C6R8_AOTNA